MTKEDESIAKWRGAFEAGKKIGEETERLRLSKLKEYSELIGTEPEIITKHKNKSVHDYCESCVDLGKELGFKIGQKAERLRTKRIIDKYVLSFKTETKCFDEGELYKCSRMTSCTECLLEDLKNKIKEAKE